MNRVIKATKLTKSEVEAINARIFFNNLKTDTLCWSCMNARDNKEPVSYTHLTLPTNNRV